MSLGMGMEWGKSMKKFCILLLAICPLGSLADTKENIKYSINTSTYSTLLTYCKVKYGEMSENTSGERCFHKGKAILSEAYINDVLEKINDKCKNKNLNYCLMPYLGNYVSALIKAFEDEKI